ncbi:MAG: NAD-dependent epimerase/dehydratase family protein [Candidatus Binatia bacterium]
MKLLVTGGAGFIGSHLVDACVAAGHDVAVIDDLSTGDAAQVNPGARLHRVDLRDRAAVDDVIARERPEVISHHAAQLDVRRSVADPVFDAQVNLIGLLNLMEAGRAHGLRRVILASSGGVVYGDSQELPTSERAPTEPISPYGVAKLGSERYLHYYWHVHGIPSVALRYGNVYGPRQNPHGEAGVVAIFTGALLDGGAPVINGPGTQTRDYVFVGDVVRANLLALASDYRGALNVGTGLETDVNRLFALLCDAIGAHPPERHGPAKAGEQLRCVLDPRRAAEAIGWRPEVELADGLSRTVDFFRRRRTAH